jgi:hypothetical protein
VREQARVERAAALVHEENLGTGVIAIVVAEADVIGQCRGSGQVDRNKGATSETCFAGHAESVPVERPAYVVYSDTDGSPSPRPVLASRPRSVASASGRKHRGGGAAAAVAVNALEISCRNVSGGENPRINGAHPSPRSQLEPPSARRLAGTVNDRGAARSTN